MNESQQMFVAKNKDPRIRYFVNSCWNCDNFIQKGLDEPEDPSFCKLDGCSVSEHQICKDWE